MYSYMSRPTRACELKFALRMPVKLLRPAVTPYTGV